MENVQCSNNIVDKYEFRKLGWEEDYMNRLYKKVEKLKTEENERFVKALFKELNNEKRKNIIIQWEKWIGKTYLIENLFVHNKRNWTNAFLITEGSFYHEYSEQNLHKRKDLTFDIREYTFELMMKTKLLIIDDIGTVPIKLKPWFLSYYLEVLNYRLKHWKKTIFITNFELKDLAKVSEDRILDRILENHKIFEIRTWKNKRHWHKINKEEF